MTNYKTVQEKASEWDVSVRHVQYLCRKGGIDGVIKKAGTWFIPDDTPPPLKSRKSGDKYFKFVGTKKKIFDSSIKLFMSKGFDATSIKDIAEAAGISQSAMYNHFKTKQEILDNIYDFYCYYFLLDRLSLEDIEPILQNGTLIDIITCVLYAFNKEYEQELYDITKIILQRNSIDDRAREITKTLMLEEGIRYVEAVFDRAIEIGRLAPMDTHAMSVFINSVRLARLHIWIVDHSPETTTKITESEMRMYQYASKFSTDLTHTNESVVS